MRTCPFCATENEPFFRFCLGCGADLDEALGPADDGASASAPAAPEPVSAQPATTPSAPAIVVPTPAVAATTTPPPTAGPKKPSAGGTHPPIAKSPVTAPRLAGSTLDPVAAPAATATTTAPGKSTTVGGPGGRAAAPRGADLRVKTLEPGSVAKVGASPAAQALAQAQLDAAERRATAPAGAAQVSKERSAETSTKKGAGSPDLPATIAKKGAHEPAKSRGRLVIILEDGTDGSVLELGGDATVMGRDGADINFPHDDFLAPRHAEFSFSGGTLQLRPLKSTNGVFLQVHQEVELESGDVFRIGQQLLCFEALAAVLGDTTGEGDASLLRLGSPVPEGAWGRLGQLIAPDTMGSVYLLGGTEVYLGRERGDITFPGDGFVSGLHAVIAHRNGRFYLKDLGSSNGTYLRLTKAVPVKRGTLVLAGQQLFRVDQG